MLSVLCLYNEANAKTVLYWRWFHFITASDKGVCKKRCKVNNELNYYYIGVEQKALN